RAALDHVAAHDTPDLASALALACHRDKLADRNANVPDDLPAVWATVGQLPRAEALARSIKGDSQAQALAEVAKTLAEGGQREQVVAVAAQAEAAARLMTNPIWQTTALAEVAGALARAGEREQAAAVATQAEAAARSTLEPGLQAHALARVAMTM